MALTPSIDPIDRQQQAVNVTSGVGQQAIQDSVGAVVSETITGAIDLEEK